MNMASVQLHQTAHTTTINIDNISSLQRKTQKKNALRPIHIIENEKWPHVYSQCDFVADSHY